MGTLILEHEKYSQAALSLYNRLGPVWLEGVHRYDPAEVRILVIRLREKITAGVLRGFPNLDYVVSPTTGSTHVDLDACRQAGVEYISLLECREALEDVTSTADLAFGLLLSLVRSIPFAHKDVVCNGSWHRDSYRGRQLNRLHLGIIGLGRIGRMMAYRANAFGMKICAYDPYLPQSSFDKCSVKRCSDIEELTASVDIASLHAALTPETHGLFSAELIWRMRRGSMIVNSARGALLDEAAAAEAVTAGHLAGVAVDVLAWEHQDRDWQSSPLLRAAQLGRRVIVTPHIGGCSDDAMHITEEAIARYLISLHKQPGESF